MGYHNEEEAKMVRRIIGAMGVIMVLWVAFWAGVGYVTFHFLSKVW